MPSFFERFAPLVIGSLSGFDRVRFRGTKRLLNTVGGRHTFLWQKRGLLKDFKGYACDATARLRRAVAQAADAAGRPLVYLNQGQRKEDLARQIARRDGVTSGLVAGFSAVECCRSYAVHPDRQSQRLVLKAGPKKCLHYYHYYYLHPQLGLPHARLQTWFPFDGRVGLNGREWLARLLDPAGGGYVKKDNGFVDLVGDFAVPYYWSAEETEWATDVLFRSAEALAGLYPRRLRHGTVVLGSADVLRYLGHKRTAQGGIHGHFTGEVLTDLKGRPEGARVKHRLGRNWGKMYDKQGGVLRVETVINDARDLKVYRAKEGDEGGEPAWRRLRKGVADLHRRAEVSQKANGRYLGSLARGADATPVGQTAEPLSAAVAWRGRRARGLNVLGGEDGRLLAAISRGEFLVNGFRNKDLRALRYAGRQQGRKGTAAVTRKVRLLRAHGLINKVPSTHRDMLTAKGREACAAILTARQADATTLAQAA